MYEIAAHFINYLRIATSPQSTQTANAAISNTATGKKNKFGSFLNNKYNCDKKCAIAGNVMCSRNTINKSSILF